MLEAGRGAAVNNQYERLGMFMVWENDNPGDRDQDPNLEACFDMRETVQLC